MGFSRYVFEGDDKDSCKIGEGAFGKVYKALDSATKQTVAMKEINVSRMDAQGRILVLQEIELQMVMSE